jgi:hypothetical protein
MSDARVLIDKDMVIGFVLNKEGGVVGFTIKWSNNGGADQNGNASNF